jgi:hypothetical protein
MSSGTVIQHSRGMSDWETDRQPADRGLAGLSAGRFVVLTGSDNSWLTG